ncbi:ABC transporter substrate-binding protein [Mycetocola tolaasinivorans]|uniref:ABC transporter substrate-binding protein n=1 Tax=Mycetocola tolaasinivorans TaxID=76635 RepID=A0A3L7A012_9MICO|nr:ABC transporter substrate-binding protein [Mycetocola tolaasinivorans]RLP73328.1 ABC transporter substrate-binding protein [Mycetocola tolaasinivorans]
MRTPRSRLALAAGLATVLALSGCAAPSPDKTDGSDAHVTVGLVLEPTDLNIRKTSGVALDQVLLDNVYEGLVRREADGSVADSLAKSHTVSPDGLTYTFTLNENVHFHSGNALTAQDVVWSLTQVLDDASVKDHATIAAIRTVTSPDPQTVVLTLSNPDSNLLWNLGGRAGQILEEKATNDLATSANGTGPFLLKKGAWKQGDSLTLDRNDDYYGAKAKVSEITFRYIQDPTAAINATLTGDLDVQTGVDANLRPQLARDADVKVTEGRTTDKYTLVFNPKVPALADPKVREALRTGIDHQAIIDSIGGAGVPQGGPIPELDPGYQDLTKEITFDPAKAKSLLAEAGQSNLTLTLTVANHYPTVISNVLTSQFKNIGVTLKVNRVEFPTWLNDVYTNHDFDLSLVNHAESRDFSNWTNPDYYFGYNNPTVQALYAESVAATDPKVVDEKLAEAARLVAADNPADWLFTGKSLTAVRSGVTGFPTDSTTSRLYLANLTVTR